MQFGFDFAAIHFGLPVQLKFGQRVFAERFVAIHSWSQFQPKFGQFELAERLAAIHIWSLHIHEASGCRHCFSFSLRAVRVVARELCHGWFGNLAIRSGG